jgi:hypothetical protein
LVGAATLPKTRDRTSIRDITPGIPSFERSIFEVEALAFFVD